MARRNPLHIKRVQVCGPHSLRLVFSDGVEKQVDVSPLIYGPVFEPLRAASYFARVSLDPVAQTVVWPNGADLAPEALWDLPDEPVVRKKRKA
jgi:hypothetical protein